MYYAERQQKVINFVIVSRNRCLPGPKDMWRNEDKKYVQSKERIKNELARK